MKSDIHPMYYENLKITCACGNIVIAGSTRKELRTELCSACHPFYTGKQKLVDTAGRVDKFMEKMKKMEEMKAKKAQKQAPQVQEDTIEKIIVKKTPAKKIKMTEAIKVVEKPKKVAVKKTKEVAVKVKKTAVKPKKKVASPKKKSDKS